MSLIKEISAKALCLSNEKLLHTIFKFPPELPTSSSYFNRILQIHKIIKDDLVGTCVVDVSHTQSEITSIETITKSLSEIENIIFGENSQTYNSSVAGCLEHTELILKKLQSKQNTCILL